MERFTIFIDGDCALCRHEARLLERLDGERNRLHIVDIAAPDFDAARYGRTQTAFMGSIHGQLADGRLVTGMEVFRRAYAAVGLGWLLAPTGWPVVRPIVDLLYRGFARLRPHLPGRTTSSCDRCAASPSLTRSTTEHTA